MSIFNAGRDSNKLFVVGELGRQYFAKEDHHGGCESSSIPCRTRRFTGRVSLRITFMDLYAESEL